jgi:RNA polymerase sigma-70 factor (ECF subfamily)
VDRIPLRFRDLVDTYMEYVYSLSYRILGNGDDAADAVQETFLKLFKNFGRIDREKSLRNWVCTIALNAARDIYRQRKRHAGAFPLDGNAAEREAGGVTPESAVTAGEVLKALPVKLRSAVVLFYIERMTIKEIARAAKISEPLVKIRLHRARKLLLKKFGTFEP